jgi:D-3-phosphoglycerate dehydrogenase
MKIVLNAEPFGYSNNAVRAWEGKGYVYQESSWKIIKETETFPEVEIIIVRLAQRVGGEILDKFPDLKILVTATTGHDHIDIDELNKRGIQLKSLRGETQFLNTIPSTAEHTWALMMSLIRNIPSANDHVQKGFWNRDLFRGYQLKNKTIGIIGFGRTGQKVAHYARAFDMRVLYFDPFVNLYSEEKVNSLNELIKDSDILSLHVHLNSSTENLINADNLSCTKPGLFIINTSRGKICDESALVNSLKNWQIRGVATDVLSSELEDIEKSPLWHAQQAGFNVIITPHVGGATWDAMWICEEFIVDSLI